MSTRNNPQRLAAVKAAVAALKADASIPQPNSAQLFAHLDKHFDDELAMLLFIANNWRELPDAIPIAEDGPGFYASSFALQRKDSDQLVTHDLTTPQPTPSADDVKAQYGYDKWDGTPTFVIAVVSRVAGAYAINDLNEASKKQDQAGDGQKSHWWNGIIIVTGPKPTRDDEVFFKWCSKTTAPALSFVYADGDPAGFAAAHQLLARSPDAPASLHSQWHAQTYSDILRGHQASKFYEMLHPSMPSNDDEVTGDLFPSRKISKEPIEVRRQLEYWCNFEELPRSALASSDKDTAEKALVSPIGDTARQLRDLDKFFRIIISQASIVNKLKWAVDEGPSADVSRPPVSPFYVIQTPRR